MQRQAHVKLASLHDHALKGAHSGERALHVAPDWLLVYKVDAEALILMLLATGIHRDTLSKIKLVKHLNFTRQSKQPFPTHFQFGDGCFCFNIRKTNLYFHCVCSTITQEPKM
ncbi:type II toxin-antitoxin system mRNA interferase toxin, RelE/StbE family [Lacticaseibacillus rhamnosus]|uniref:type II toxin-antitoxin system mRNA interferase toxin, RelE/StbE family n=1 Tax=Lacticaseibacillus rhamnosus TaxID=47715 RepID=UPI001F436FD3|nr:type II toxin-antitoxin system mRNA interferase toxin, RelE/StbE family [Lacticaseibacillus rhamnosus]